MNTRLINEAKTALDSAEIGAIASLTERLEANNTELERLNAMIEEYVTDEEFAAEFETIIKYQDAARGMLSELKARQEILRNCVKPPKKAKVRSLATLSDGRDAHSPPLKQPSFCFHRCE